LQQVVIYLIPSPCPARRWLELPSYLPVAFHGSLPMSYLIEKVVRVARVETIRLTGPTELDLTVPDQAKFVICNHTIEQGHRGVK
jgi:hypothetical protein